MAYDIELNPKVKDNGEIEKLEKNRKNNWQRNIA